MSASKFAPFLVGAALVVADPISAESEWRDADYVAERCAESHCQKTLSRTVREYRKQTDSPEEYNSKLAQLASALFETARDAEDRFSQRRAANAMTRLARYARDPEQRRNILRAARAIRNGNEDFFDLDDPFAASPS